MTILTIYLIGVAAVALFTIAFNRDGRLYYTESPLLAGVLFSVFWPAAVIALIVIVLFAIIAELRFGS